MCILREERAILLTLLMCWKRIVRDAAIFADRFDVMVAAGGTLRVVEQLI